VEQMGNKESMEKALAMEKNIPLGEQVANLIRAKIDDGTFIPGSRLPSESELTRICNVSRTTIRSSLATLTAEGLLERRWGDGTYVRWVPQISNPIDRALDFTELIAGAGFKPAYESMKTISAKASEVIAGDLHIQAGSAILRSELIISGDGDPLVYCVNFIPCEVLGSDPEALVQEGVSTEPLFEFIETNCEETVSHHVANLWADLAKNFPIPMPNWDPDHPVLVMKSIGYNMAGKPIFVSLSGYPDTRMEFQLLRQH
jgi:GntR family transcriptional regulator